MTSGSISSYQFTMLVNRRTIQMLYTPIQDTRQNVDILGAMKTLATAIAGRIPA